MATHYCDKCMATAVLGGEPSKVCDSPPHHFVSVVPAASTLAPAGKFTFQSHFSPAIKFEYIYYILFDMLSLFISCYNPVPVIFI
jgi:hypothetical protein